MNKKDLINTKGYNENMALPIVLHKYDENLHQYEPFCIDANTIKSMRRSRQVCKDEITIQTQIDMEKSDSVFCIESIERVFEEIGSAFVNMDREDKVEMLLKTLL